MDPGLGHMLRNGDAYEKLEAMRATAMAGRAAASLVPDLAALLLSDEYVHNINTAHAPLCEHATYAIRDIGVAPDRETLRALLASDRVMAFPVACFDQGLYVGDYADENFAPAGLAANLVLLMSISGLTLLPELLANAGKADETIAEPAERAVAKLTALVAEADPGLAARLAREIDAARSSSRTANVSNRHRELHDLIDLCIKQLDGQPPRG
jgi:hypothetical protein